MACGESTKGSSTGSAAGAAGAAGGGASSAGSSQGGTGASAAGSGGGSDAGGGEAGAPEEAGAAGATPVELGERIELVRDQVSNKLDLLFMIDNSISMVDKQQLLADAMQHLVDRLLQPHCLDELGQPTGQKASVQGVCPGGQHPEFLPFVDIHAAVITSSLGAHGATGLSDVCVSVEDDDHARLLGSIRVGLPSWNDQGFLVWDPAQALTPPGSADPTEFAADLAETVESAGGQGCGYEATLEAWYRFLVDPEPPAAVVQVNGVAQVQGIDTQVLAEREAFLRSDSVLGIVLLSDENDCSVVDEGYGWLLHRSQPMYRSTSQCLEDPNDACCQSCASGSANAGCPDLGLDSECLKGSTYSAPGEDDLNLRCYEQKRRFGFSLLYPTQRYVDALTLAQVKRRSDGALVPNPIYASRDGAPPRSAEQVLLLGIVGVPWQDIADAASLTGDGLKFLSEDAPLSEERWALILGDAEQSPPLLPTDPFMVESPQDRTTLDIPQANPIVPDEKLIAAGSTDPRANAINGHETLNLNNNDLQFACTFELAAPLLCDQAAFDAGDSCDCFAADTSYERSLCQPPTGGAAATTQYFGKAYPGLRQLAVLKGVRGHGVVASACPKSADLTSDSYGYRPAMDALAGRVAGQVGRSCLKRDAQAGPDGRTACQLITVTSQASCSCAGEEGLAAAPAEAVAPVLEELQNVGYCVGAECDALCLCELQQLAGSELESCQSDAEPPSVPGFCYLNAVPGEAHAGDAELAADCVGAAARRIRFTGGAPGGSSLSLLYCAE